MITLILGCALAAYPVINAARLAPLAATLAVLGLLFVILAIFLKEQFIGIALLTLTVQYLVTEATGSVSTLSIGVYAVGLIVLCELVFWTRRLAACARVDTSVVTGWLYGVALLGVAAALLTVTAFAATGLRIPGCVTATDVVSAAAVAVLDMPWLLAKPKHADGRGQRRRSAPSRHLRDRARGD